MSCHHELANEWARCREKNASYITIAVNTVQAAGKTSLVKDAWKRGLWVYNGKGHIGLLYLSNPLTNVITATEATLRNFSFIQVKSLVEKWHVRKTGVLKVKLVA